MFAKISFIFPPDGFTGDLTLWVKTLLPAVNKRVYNLQSKQLVKLYSQVAVIILQFMNNLAGHEIAPDTGANVTKFFTLVTKS